MKKTSCLTDEAIKLIVNSYKAQYEQNDKNEMSLDESGKDSLKETRPDSSLEVRLYKERFN